MKRIIYKKISFILALILMIIGVDLPLNSQLVYAENHNTEGDNSIIENTISVGADSEASNPVSLLAKIVSEHVEEQAENQTQECFMTNLIIENQKAIVTYSTNCLADIVVAIYDENSKVMLASGTTQVSIETNEVVIPITGTIPTYFIATAFLLEKDSHYPLSKEYTTTLYTKGVQDIVDATIEDYDAEQVLNFDSDDTTNFAVYNDDVVRLENKDNINQIESNADHTYVIRKADENAKDLSAGDIFSLENEDGSIFIIKVRAIDVDGDVVTIIEDPDIEAMDAFKVVKVETSSVDSTVDESTCGEGITYLGKENETRQLRSVESEVDASHVEEFEIKQEYQGEYGTVTMSGTLKMDLQANITVYLSLFESYVRTSLDYAFGFQLKISGEIPRNSWEIAKITLRTSIPELYVYFEPSVVYEFSASLTWNVTYHGSIGSEWNSKDSGVKDISVPPILESTVDYEGKVYIGIAGDLGIQLGRLKRSDGEEDGILSAGCMLEVGVTVSAKGNGKKNSEDPHLCNSCISGEIKGKLTWALHAEFIGEELFNIDLYDNSEISLGDYSKFYYSLDYNEFGWKTCPHYEHNITKFSGDDWEVIQFNDPYYVGPFKMDAGAQWQMNVASGMSAFLCYFENISTYSTSLCKCRLYLYDKDNKLIEELDGIFSPTQPGQTTWSDGRRLQFNSSITWTHKQKPEYLDVVRYEIALLEQVEDNGGVTSIAETLNEGRTQLKSNIFLLNAKESGEVFENLIPKEQYVRIAVKNPSALEFFASENLVYILQGEADSFGKLKFDSPEQGADVTTNLYGKRYFNLYPQNVSVEPMIYTGQQQQVKVSVMDDSKVLQEGIDYKLSGDIQVSDIGKYQVIVEGIGIYKGNIVIDFEVKKNESENSFVGGSSESNGGASAGGNSGGGGASSGGMTDLPPDQTDPMVADGEEVSDKIGDKVIQAERLVVKTPTKKIAAGKKISLSVRFEPNDVSKQSVIWKTSNKKYATVNKNGVVTTKKAGAGKTVTITAVSTDGSGVKATVKLQIMKDAVSKIKLIVPKKTIKVGDSLQLVADVLATGKNSNKTLKWSCSNTKYATVDQKGKVKAKKAGSGKTVTITAMATDGSGKKASVKIKIK